MKNQLKTKYVCIHGHFYQPPRENPWLGEIEREDSAIPYHDWNERIDTECYRANAAARLTDDANRVLSLRNNYKYFSFNFGPTLMQWLEQHDPWAYRAIIEADRESVKARGGHGNAIAQVYNHVIMPLANQRDKVTQVLWGIRDFEYRFGRRPEGMWLAETAVDRNTLSVLAGAGIKFTILSPHQAAQWRLIGPSTPQGAHSALQAVPSTPQGDQWCEARGGTIPTGRPYLFDCGGGKHIYIFFYDAELARGVAFERLLDHSSRLLAQIGRSFAGRDLPDNEAWLVNVATDGESYGHHFKFGDMALAAAFQELERDPDVEVTNYGAFLASFPVVAEVELIENTAWSCAHGLGRWSGDCGCHVSGGPGWNQKWRAPLRSALDFARDAMAVHFEKEMKKLCRDPWKARNDYIDALLDPKGAMEKFLQHHLGAGRASSRASRFLELLEVQRFALYMFTSCGWFFDDISQIESLLLLKFATRAIQLAERTGAPPIEPGFLKILEKAPSNVAEYKSGADVYLRAAKTQISDKRRVAANYAIQTLARTSQRQFQIYTYGITPHREDDLGSNPVPCLYGHVTVKNGRTLSEEQFLYAVLHFGGLDFHCSVKPYAGDEEYGEILEELQECVERQNTIEMLRVLDRRFGPDYFGLNEVFRDLGSAIALEISREALATYTDFQRGLFHVYKPLISSLRQWGIRVPGDIRGAVRRLLGEEAEQVVRKMIDHERENLSSAAPWNSTDFFFRAHLAKLHSMLEEAKTWGVSIQTEALSAEMGRELVQSAAGLADNFYQAEAGRLFRLLTICDGLSIRPESWKLQTLYFEFTTRGAERPELFGRIENVEELLQQLDRMLWCRFARLYREVPHAVEAKPAKTAALRVVPKHRQHGSD